MDRQGRIEGSEALAPERAYITQ